MCRASELGENLLHDLIAESSDLRIEGLDGILLLFLQVLKRLSKLPLHLLPALNELHLELRCRLLLHLVKCGGDLGACCLHDGGGLLLELLDLLGGILDFAELGADGGVAAVHELAERSEVDLIEGDHEEKELDGDGGEGEVEVEESGLLDLGGEGWERGGDEGGSAENESARRNGDGFDQGSERGGDCLRGGKERARRMVGIGE